MQRTETGPEINQESCVVQTLRLNNRITAQEEACHGRKLHCTRNRHAQALARTSSTSTGLLKIQDFLYSLLEVLRQVNCIVLYFKKQSLGSDCVMAENFIKFDQDKSDLTRPFPWGNLSVTKQWIKIVHFNPFLGWNYEHLPSEINHDFPGKF